VQGEAVLHRAEMSWTARGIKRRTKTAGIASLQMVHNRHVSEAMGHKFPEKMRHIHITWLSFVGRTHEFLKCQNREYVPAAAWSLTNNSAHVYGSRISY
jgi:hypothetical protein